MRACYAAITVLLLACGTTLGSAQTFDLVEVTVNDVPLCSLVLDNVIDLLGRPSVVTQPVVLPLSGEVAFGPTLAYHDRGLRFSFDGGEVGQEPLSVVDIYLSRTWDTDNSKWYAVVEGGLRPAATNQWRVAQSLEALVPLGGVEWTPEEREARFEAQGLGEYIEMPDFTHLVVVDFDTGTRLVFHHEPVTRFLERIGVLCPS